MLNKKEFENYQSQLFSRQFGTIPKETNLKLFNYKVLVIGMKPLGIEIAKNSLMLGVSDMSLLDKNKLEKISDLQQNYIAREESIGLRRDEACLIYFQEQFNFHQKVQIIKEISDEVIKEMNVVILTQLDYFSPSETMGLNDKCRQFNVKFIFTCCKGLDSFIYEDFGKEFQVHYQPLKAQILHVYPSDVKPINNPEDYEELKNSSENEAGQYSLYKNDIATTILGYSDNHDKFQLNDIVESGNLLFKIIEIRKSTLIEYQQFQSETKSNQKKQKKFKLNLQQQKNEINLNEETKEYCQQIEEDKQNQKQEEQNEDSQQQQQDNLEILQKTFVAKIQLFNKKNLQTLDLDCQIKLNKDSLQKYLQENKKILKQLEPKQYSHFSLKQFQDLFIQKQSTEENQENEEKEDQKNQENEEEEECQNSKENLNSKLKQFSDSADYRYNYFVALMSLFQYYEEYNRYPQRKHIEDCKQFQAIFLNQFKNKFKRLKNKNVEEIESLKQSYNQFSLLFIIYLDIEILPMSTMIGGIVAQEVISSLGCSSKPIDQFLFYENRALLTNEQIADIMDFKFKDKESDNNFVQIFGQDTFNLMKNLNILMVGAGALGNEYIKMLASMGFCTGQNSQLTLVDNDRIELSNLSRQMFFKHKHIKQYKAKILSEAATKIQKNMKIQYKALKINEQSEYTDFPDKFYEQQQLIIVGVDNIDARLYLQQQQIHHRIPLLIEAGTKGLVGQTHISIYGFNHPLTSKYRQETEEEQNHCLPVTPTSSLDNIPWSLSTFKEQFCENLTNLQTEIQNAQNFEELFHFENNQQKQLCIPRKTWIGIILMRNEPESNTFLFEACISVFEIFFKNDENKSFQQQSEQFRKQHQQTVLSLVKVISYLIDVKYQENQFECCYQRFLERNNIIQKNKDSDSQQYQLQEDISQIFTQKNLQSKFEEENSFAELKKFKFRISLFDKDDDEGKGHIEIITSFTNMRSCLFNLEELSLEDIRIKAGKITPAIITTTAFVSGFAFLELIKCLNKSHLILNKQKHEQNFIDQLQIMNADSKLGSDLFQTQIQKCKPLQKQFIQGTDQFDFIEIEGENQMITCDDVVKYVLKKFKVKVKSINIFLNKAHVNLNSSWQIFSADQYLIRRNKQEINKRHQPQAKIIDLIANCYQEPQLSNIFNQQLTREYILHQVRNKEFIYLYIDVISQNEEILSLPKLRFKERFLENIQNNQQGKNNFFKIAAHKGITFLKTKARQVRLLHFVLLFITWGYMSDFHPKQCAIAQLIMQKIY